MNLLDKAIRSVQSAELAFSKFITANDVGATGGHQSGFHIHKQAWPFFFEREGMKGSNKDRFVTIRWQDSFETTSRCIYYGKGTRNEYRLTRFGKGFPFLNDGAIGDLLVLVRKSHDHYEAYVLSSDTDIDDFFVALNISSSETNGLIPKQAMPKAKDLLSGCFQAYIESLGNVEFPPTSELAYHARVCHNLAHGVGSKNIESYPDRYILEWLETEYSLFRMIENSRYADIIRRPFTTVEAFINTAGTIMNRRKSRAGKSLEHHLEEIFNLVRLVFQTQAKTEHHKKPDFLFPNIDAYNNPSFDNGKLVLLASKTTCKDRWRQILNEADRIPKKHLFTLQQGISRNQLSEMEKYGVQLVVPKVYHSSFPKEYRANILTLEEFIRFVRSTQSESL